jgi:Ca2+-binding RTX toxin-like protein
MALLRPLLISGPSTNRVDIIFMGDGYTSADIHSTYSSQISQFLAYLFDGGLLTQPFGRYRSLFNIYAIDLVSAQSGADDPVNGIGRNTILNASYRFDGATDRLLYIDEWIARDIEKSVLSGTGIGAEMRFVIVNDDKYGGGGGYYAVFSGGNALAHEIALHETGHAFARLADEYSYGGPTRYGGADPSQANVTTDAGGRKWAQWLGYDQPGIGVIGAYEGGYYSEAGVYRPSLDSKMRSLNQPFDAIAREQFIRRFYEFVDPLDGYTDNTTAKLNPTSLSVDVIDPAIIAVDWRVGNRTFPGHGETLTFDFDYFDFGTHSVTARAYDATDWVRGDRSALEQNVTWSIVNLVRLTGGPLNDTLIGNGYSNDIQGRGGNDRLLGGSGADTLVGGAGSDRLEGGPGNDLFYVDRRSDRVLEYARKGTDTVLASASYALGAGMSVESLRTDNSLGTKAMSLVGNELANRIIANAGANTLSGKAGNDVLTGGRGRDAFVFDVALNGRSNYDRVTDFRSADDVMRLENRYFTAFEKTGSISPSAFHVGRAAHDADDRIVYNRPSGVLSYDPDGIGMKPAVKFAELDDGTGITYRDFYII